MACSSIGGTAWSFGRLGEGTVERRCLERAYRNRLERADRDDVAACGREMAGKAQFESSIAMSCRGRYRASRPSTVKRLDDLGRARRMRSTHRQGAPR